LPFRPSFPSLYVRPPLFSPIHPSTHPSFTLPSSVYTYIHPPFHSSFLHLDLDPTAFSPVVSPSVRTSNRLFTRPSYVCTYIQPPLHPSFLRVYVLPQTHLQFCIVLIFLGAGGQTEQARSVTC
jgi:hypothetical protein